MAFQRTISDNRPRSVPALKLLSRAASSVGIYRTIPTVPTQGAIPEEGGKEKKEVNFMFYSEIKRSK